VKKNVPTLLSVDEVRQPFCPDVLVPLVFEGGDATDGDDDQQSQTQPSFETHFIGPKTNQTFSNLNHRFYTKKSN
jgi:hypothetical protein